MRNIHHAGLVLLVAGGACAQAPNTLTQEEKGQGFKLLFDGTMQSVRDNFVTYQKDGATVTTLPANIQAAASGEYFFDNNATQDIRTKLMYDDFELRLDYRISDNAGLFYRTALLTSSIFENAIEYPLYNGTPVPGDWNAPGAAYDIYPPTVNNYKAFGTGEWNSIRVRLHKDSAYHWHNGVQVVKFSFLSSDYLTRKVARKWANAPCVAVEAASQSLCDHGNPYRKTGYIGFQTGYPGQLYLRNLRVAKYPFQEATRLERNPSSGAKPSRLFAAPARGKGGGGILVRVGAGAAWRLGLHRADGSRIRQSRGEGEARTLELPAPTPGRYFIRFVSAGQADVHTVLVD